MPSSGQWVEFAGQKGVGHLFRFSGSRFFPRGLLGLGFFEHGHEFDHLGDVSDANFGARVAGEHARQEWEAVELVHLAEAVGPGVEVGTEFVHGKPVGLEFVNAALFLENEVSAKEGRAADEHSRAALKRPGGSEFVSGEGRENRDEGQ